MARVALAITDIDRAGVAAPVETNGDTVNGHSVANSRNLVVLVRNADSVGAHTVTFVTPSTLDGLGVADHAVSIPISASRYFGGFSQAAFGSSVLVDVDSAQLKLSAFRV